jgi:hypothetical protein
MPSDSRESRSSLEEIHNLGWNDLEEIVKFRRFLKGDVIHGYLGYNIIYI